jgi:hypothetical protein
MECVCSLFNDTLISGDYIVSWKRISEWRFGKDVKGSSCGLIWGIIITFTGGTEENHEKPQSG